MNKKAKKSQKVSNIPEPWSTLALSPSSIKAKAIQKSLTTTPPGREHGKGQYLISSYRRGNKGKIKGKKLTLSVKTESRRKLAKGLNCLKTVITNPQITTSTNEAQHLTTLINKNQGLKIIRIKTQSNLGDLSKSSIG
jgi:hypothetical protein